MRKSHLVAILPFFASLASAQTFPNCTSGWDWSYNSLGQNPCNVAAYLEGTCTNGIFTIAPLPQGALYRGPNAGQDNLCVCNTVVYSLVSACGACQGASSWIQWSEWDTNCSTSASAGTYSNAIPSGTLVPHWAYLDVTGADTWNETLARNAGDTPENAPSTTSTSSKAGATSTTTGSSGSKKSSNTGAIAGGVVGGILGVTLLVGFIVWYTRRRRWRSGAKPSPFMTDEPHVAQAFGLSDPETSRTMPKLYDPSDPSTYPTTSLVSPSTTVIQTTPGSEITHSPSPPLSVSDRNRYTGLPIL